VCSQVLKRSDWNVVRDESRDEGKWEALSSEFGVGLQCTLSIFSMRFPEVASASDGCVLGVEVEGEADLVERA
jgi:hypothetical protein